MNSEKILNSISRDDWSSANNSMSDFMNLIVAVAKDNDLNPSKKDEYLKARKLASELVANKIRNEKNAEAGK